MYAVMIDNVGQRGAHRVAYLDYYETTAPQTTQQKSENPRDSPSLFSSRLLRVAAIISVTFFAIAKYR
jgi:hypothetical protein